MIIRSTVRRVGKVTYAVLGGWGGGLEERERLQDLGVDGRTMLKRIFKKKRDGRVWITFICVIKKYSGIFKSE
jgi:hypothetical protein